MNSYFYDRIIQRLRFYIRPGDSFRELDPPNERFCSEFGSGESEDHQSERLSEGGLNYLLLNGNVHREKDLIAFFRDRVSQVSDPDTRVVVLFYSSLWRPLWKLANRFGWRTKSTLEENWVSPSDLRNLAEICGFEEVRRDSGILCPIRIPLIDWIANRIFANLPGVSALNWLNISILRKKSDWKERDDSTPSVSVIIPARNEAGNIEDAIRRLPVMGPNDEIIFVEGNSSDDTWERIEAVVKNPGAGERREVRAFRQDGKGKGDAVRKGFSEARREILMILDADLTTPPEDMPYFYQSLIEDRGEFVNGNRLVLPMEDEAMRFLNLCGNKFFAVAFSIVLGQTLKDTLCGTKVLRKKHYEELAKRRDLFGNFDPFGDFDLIFGAARMGLRIVEVPVRYRNRTYGETNISRWRHGMILLRMLVFATRRFRIW